MEQCHKLLVEAYGCNGGLQMAKAFLHSGDPVQQPQPGNLPWCIWGHCRQMDQPVENVCCQSVPCVTTQDFFETVVLDFNVLLAAIASRADIFADEISREPSDYRKAAYQQYMMWKYGYLGRSNRQVVPSCVVWKVRSCYPSPDGNYMGYKEY